MADQPGSAAPRPARAESVALGGPGTGTAAAADTGASANTWDPEPMDGQQYSMEERLYGKANLEQALRDVEDPQRHVLGQSERDRAVHNREVTNVIHGAGLPEGMARALIQRTVRAQVEDAQGREVDDAPVRAAAVDSRRQLTDLYGATEADRLLEETTAWVKRQRGLAPLLADPRVANQPEILLPLVEHVRRVNSARRIAAARRAGSA